MTQVGVRDATGRFTETFEIFVKLPGPGSLTPINVRHDTTVAHLKSLIELVCGIPSDLQLLSYRHHAVLIDGDTLGTLCVLPGARLPVKIVYGYDGLVDATLRGDVKEVLQRVTITKETGGMARRRFVAMFIAAHRGYHYLVDRMLCEGAHPDTQTPSGRTTLHVAGAMGNSGCLDSLLQHGASLNLKDASGKTPADTAASCGQQGVHRRLILYSKILANKATRKKPCGWPTSPRFPQSKLGSSVTPTISMQDLAISPGPELMITAWNGREHHHHYFERRPRSAKSSLFQTDSNASSTDNWSSLKDGSVTIGQYHLAATASSAESSVPQTGRHEPMMARSVHLYNRPKSAISPSGKHDKAKSPSPKSVKFAFGETLTPSSSMSKYSSYYRGSAAPRPADSDRYCMQNSSRTLSATSISDEQFDNHHHKSVLRKTNHTKDKHEERSTPNGNETENLVTSISESSQAVYQAGSQTGDTVADETSSESSSHSSQESNSKEVNDLRINYVNDKLRDMIGFPVQHPQRLEFMKEEEEKQIRSTSPIKMTRKPTPEENEQAFKDWLASKTQDARDRRLANRVGKMLNDAFGEKYETRIVDEDEDQTQKRIHLKFEAWSEKKATQEKLHSIRQTAERAKREQRKKEQLAARLNSGTTVESWLEEKIKKQRHERLAEKQRETERQQQTAEREKAAQDVFQKWCMQKEWEELQMLKGRLDSGSKRRPKSGNSTRRKTQGARASSRRTRSHSAPPKRNPMSVV